MSLSFALFDKDSYAEGIAKNSTAHLRRLIPVLEDVQRRARADRDAGNETGALARLAIIWAELRRRETQHAA